MAHETIWSLEGDAHLLNWLDVCISKSEIYSRWAYTRYRQATHTNTPTAAIREHACWLFEKYGSRVEISDVSKIPSEVLTRGTSSLNLSSIPEDLKRAMNEGRKKRGLGPLKESSQRDSEAEVSVLTSHISGMQLTNNQHIETTEQSDAHVARSTRFALEGSQTDTVDAVTADTVTASSPEGSNGCAPTVVTADTRTASTQTIPEVAIPPPEFDGDSYGTIIYSLKMLQEKHGATSQAEDRLQSIKGVVFEKLFEALMIVAQDFFEMQKSYEDQGNTLENLVGDPNWFDDDFDPTTPSEKMLASKWTELHQSLKEAVGLSGDRFLPSGLSAALLATHSESLIGARVSDLNFSKWIRDLELRNPDFHTSHWVMSVVLFTSIFSPKEATHDVKTWKVLDYVLGVVEQASSKSQSCKRAIPPPADDELEGNLTTANMCRRIGLKFQYNDKEHRNTKMKAEVDQLLDTWLESWKVLRQCTEITPAMKGSTNLLQDMVELRQKLVVSSKDYKIIWFLPGTKYDPNWMEIETATWQPVTDQPTGHSEVRMCLWPAFAHHPSDPNKRVSATDNTFLHFMDKDSSFEGSDLVMIAKAIVLLSRPDE